MTKYGRLDMDMQEFIEEARSNKMITVAILSFLGGGLITGVVGWQIQKKESDTAELVTAIGQLQDKVAEGQVEVQKQLTDTDLLAIPCGLDFIEKHGDLLCREMFCRMTTRGIDSKTSGGECERISNIADKQLILHECSKLGDAYQGCVELFDRRL